jgi:hypothetical protein
VLLKRQARELAGVWRGRIWIVGVFVMATIVTGFVYVVMIVRVRMVMIEVGIGRGEGV